MKELVTFLIVMFIVSWAAFSVVGLANLDVVMMVAVTVVVAVTTGIVMGFYSAAHDDADQFRLRRPLGSSVYGYFMIAGTFINVGIALNASANAWSVNFLWGAVAFVVLFILNLVLLSVSSEMIGTPLERRFFREFERARRSTRQPLGHGIEN